MAIADRLPLKFATTHSRPCSYGTHNELLKDPRVDEVYIYIYIYIYIAIHVTHHDIALKVIEADKPVLCEKPITIRASDTKEMVDKAREINCILDGAVSFLL